MKGWQSSFLSSQAKFPVMSFIFWVALDAIPHSLSWMPSGLTLRSTGSQGSFSVHLHHRLTFVPSPNVEIVSKAICFSDDYDYSMTFVISSVLYEMCYVNTWYWVCEMIILMEVPCKVYSLKNCECMWMCQIDSGLDNHFFKDLGCRSICLVFKCLCFLVSRRKYALVD